MRCCYFRAAFVVKENAMSLNLSLGYYHSFKCSGMSFCDTRQSIQNFKEKWASLYQGTWLGLWKHTISYLFMFYFKSLSIFEIFSFVSPHLESTWQVTLLNMAEIQNLLFQLNERVAEMIHYFSADIKSVAIHNHCLLYLGFYIWAVSKILGENRVKI